ncbi:MAG: TetR/AcrR family transcriptional regulator [Goleter apudmare HA4340-LM2]|jgi:AcrR family transcriptional regulator|nr:TetR/AcrR family transcriptional regulator [Goleter apudmare HA4340-LM2]
MARIPKITNQQILEAARNVFLQKGFSGSTLEIAQRAGISEASIFKRFSTKEELFFAAIGIPDKPLWIQELNSLLGKGDIKQNLIQICHQILEFHREVMPLLMMLRSRGKALPEMGLESESKPVRDLKILTGFLEHEIKQGRLRACEPKTIAHTLLGSLMNYVLLEQMLSPPESITDLSKDDSFFIQSLVEIIWQGIAPTQN